MSDDQNKRESQGKSLLDQWLTFSEESLDRPEPRSVDRLEGPASFGQERLYFLQTVFPENPFYHYAELYHFSGNISPDHLSSAFEKVVEEHDILRTVFESRDDGVYQIIRNIPPEIIRTETILETSEDVEHAARQYARRPFDLLAGPLVRLVLFPTENGISALVCMHHIITDKWSMRVLRSDWSAFYMAMGKGASVDLVTDAVRYMDYSFDQKAGKYSTESLDYWKDKLKDLPAEMSIDHDLVRPKRPTYKGRFQQQQLGAERSKKVLELARVLEVTPYTLMLAVYKVLLSKQTHSSDVIIGSPISNRTDERLEKAIGFFNETLVLRSEVNGNASFRELVGHVNGTVLEAFDHSAVPFEALVKELHPPRQENVNPIFQAMFLYHDVPESPSFGPGIDLEYEPFDLGVAKFDLTLYVSNDQDSLSVIVEYATDIFKAERMKQLVDQYIHLLDQTTQDPGIKVSDLRLMPHSIEKIFLEELNGPEKPLTNKTVVDAYLDNVRQYPERPAVSHTDSTWTYGQLAQRVDIISAALLDRGIHSGEGVGLMISAGNDMIAGLLGILRIGGHYVPVDPDYPEKRRRLMLEDSGVKVVLVDRHVPREELIDGIDYLDLNDLTEVPPDLLEFPDVLPEDLAYMIYTSGSTGKPKAVMVTHANLLNSTAARLTYYGDDPCTYLLMSSYAFDSSVAGIFWSIYSGGHLVLKPHRGEQDVDLLARTIADKKVTHTLMLPSLYDVILQNADPELLGSLEKVIVAGEACSISVVKHHQEKLPDAHLYNEYGPTEATVWSTVARLDEMEGEVSIGKAIQNTVTYVLGPSGELMPPGVRGELAIGGKNVSPGYFERPELTAERFIPDPREKGAMMYRTGDLVKYTRDGQLYFLGRTDEQVKVRGHRIELSAVDAVACEIEGLIEAATRVYEKNGSKRFTLFYTGDIEKVEDVRHYLLDRLPRFMVPDHIVEVDHMPRLPNGKIDNKALEGLDGTSAQREEGSRPLTVEETILANIWKGILGVTSVDPMDNFFSLGGDSIKSIQLSAQVRKQGYDLAPDAVFTFQTLQELATDLKSADKDDGVAVTGSAPLLPIHRWFFNNHKTKTGHWGQAFHLNLKKGVSKEALEEALAGLLRHHDGLRASFDPGIDEMSIAAPLSTIEDIISWREEAPESISEAISRIMSRMVPSEGQLFRVLAIGDPEVHEVILMAHHLVIDAYSWPVVLEDLDVLLSDHGASLPSRSTNLLRWSEALTELTGDADKEYWSEQKYEPNELKDVSVPDDRLKEGMAQTILLELSFPGFFLNGAEGNALNVKRNEFLLAVMVAALSGKNRSENLVVHLENTGRNNGMPGTDLSRTVGWLTSLYALPFSGPKRFSDLQDFVIHVKEKWRSVPRDGLGYGINAYNVGSAFSGAEGMDRGPGITFNYLPDMSSSEEFNILSEPSFMTKGVRHENCEKDAALEINAYEATGSWKIYLTFDPRAMNRSWMAEFENRCAEWHKAIEELLSTGAGRATPSDFPDAEIDQDDLDTLMDQFE